MTETAQVMEPEVQLPRRGRGPSPLTKTVMRTALAAARAEGLPLREIRIVGAEVSLVVGDPLPVEGIEQKRNEAGDKIDAMSEGE